MNIWGRDLEVSFNTAAGQGGMGKINSYIFHLLRLIGWTWLWECDGTAADPNRCPDGNMEAAGVGSWTAVGTGSLAKDTSEFHSGTQSLEITAPATSDGARSAALTSMDDSTDYRVAIWAYNDSGVAWDVEVDDGSGSFSSVGTIPDNSGVWTLYEFAFTTHTSGTRYIRVVNDLGTGGEVVYVDGILIWRSWFEHNVDQEGTDGTLTNPDEFSSTGYTFVAGDVGKVIVVHDPTNVGNTGWYTIASVAAGVATLEMRSTTAAFTTQGSLAWRMLDPANAPDDTSSSSAIGAGWMLESPHSSSWRLKCRYNLTYGSTDKGVSYASSPVDTDFDFSTGNFYPSGPSTQRSMQGDYYYTTSGFWSDTAFWRGPAIGTGYGVTSPCRAFLKTDSDGSYVASVVFEQGAGYHGAFLVGYTGNDSYHPGIQEFLQQMRWEDRTRAGEINFTTDDDRYFPYVGIGFTPDDLAVWTNLAQEGIGAGTVNPWVRSLACANQFSGDEQLRPLIIARDPTGDEGFPSIRESNIGIYQGRSTLPDLSTFDSDQYLHFKDGYVWEWPGVDVL